ncbi:MAG: cobalamin biosynthesis protein CbiX [Amylibacter sp.]|nr:cobalamin biosynthesis protein CbiX [Amylibacter sp.]
MYGIKSPSRMAPATEAASNEVLIVAHGAPSDPEPQEVALKELADRVAKLLPNWHVRSATLAAPGALDRALDGMTAPHVYPFFMAEGWFTGTHLPARLLSAGASGVHLSAPFGSDTALADLVLDTALSAAATAGFPPSQTNLLVAAHGGKRSGASAEATYALVREIEDRGEFCTVAAGFLEQEPFVTTVAHDLCGISDANKKHVVCLPVFALRAGHVVQDIPKALSQAGFDGLLLPHIGDHGRVPEMIAAALKRASVTQVA